MNENQIPPENQTLYWLWLQNALGCGAKLADIMDCYRSPREIYEAGSVDWRVSGLFTPRQVERMGDAELEDAQKITDQCKKQNWRVMTPCDDDYPARLRDLIDFPAALYIDGALPAVDDEVMIAVVGTRSATPYGLEVTARLCSSLAAAGAVIVSGGALGIDTAAHRAALSGGGKTVAFLGCGLGNGYLRENADLRAQIAKRGAVVSEYPPYADASKATFPIRNRLIAGISLGTLVIEAGFKSGSLITADLAVEQGRDVFAVPGSVISPVYSGVNKLIADGAKPVFSAYDILDEYAPRFPHKLDMRKAGAAEKAAKARRDVPMPDPAPADTEAGGYGAENTAPIFEKPLRHEPPDLTPAQKAIYDLLLGGPMHVDEITAAAEMTVSEALRTLTELELTGAVQSMTGRRYMLSN